ncbi:MAG: hypothetical protein ACK5WV_07935 [Chryseotalea sp.]|jgi:hypothetical protein
MAKAKSQKTTKKSEAANLRALKSDLQSFGYLLPTNDEELEEFEKMFGKTQVMFPEHLKKPDFLKEATESGNRKEVQVSKAESAEKKAKVKNIAAKTAFKRNDYFKKLVLAAEIANQLHEEPTFGHVKFVKIQYLCDQVCGMELSTQYSRHAAGPLDAKQLYSVDAEFKRRKWFTITRTEFGGYKYHPSEKINDYKVYFSRYYHNQLDKINSIIDLFRKKNSDFCEIVATIYFLWNEFIEKRKLVNNASLIHDFYEWHDKKKRFKETEIVKAIEWMTTHDIVPKNNLN